MNNVVYLKNMATQDMIKKLHKLLINIVSRNNYTTTTEILKVISQHFDSEYPNIDQLRYALRDIGIVKEKKFYVYKPENNVIEYRKCYRCLKNKNFKLFRKCYPKAYGDIGYNNRLVICNDCIEEEESITGETKKELIGIYALLQKTYKNDLDYKMYNKFWEKYLYR
tara:strand:- start:2353 stop:2853 length:501 start_codon:yes stop_codon:yes gene_type:complete